MTNAEAWFNKSLRPRKPEGSLGLTAQDVHLDSHTAPELWLCSPLFRLGFVSTLGVANVIHQEQEQEELGQFQNDPMLTEAVEATIGNNAITF